MATFLLLVRGLPGSGKSTFAKKYAEEHDAAHLEADMWVPECPDDQYLYVKENAGYYHASCLAQTFYNLMHGESCVVSNTFTQYQEIAPYIDIANRAKAKLSIYICRGNFGTIHPVPPEVIKLMEDRWEE
jgi:predicted kinase